MPNLPVTRFAVLAGVAGMLAAGLAFDSSEVRAESAIQFLLRQHRQQYRPPAYQREPVRVPRTKLFDRFFEFDRPEPPRRRAAAPPALERVVCKRSCDGAQFVFGIGPAGGRKEAKAMCAAAGGDAKTELIVEKFVPGAGFDVPEPVRVATTGSLREGRAALDTNTVHQPPPHGSPCAANPATPGFMTIPIKYDATLRAGDVVATRAGFKVFIGQGKPPFRDRDFVDVSKAKYRVSSDIRKLKISGR